MSFESSCDKFFVNSLGPTASMSSTCTPVQMSSPVFANRHGSRYLEQSHVVFTCQAKVLASVSEIHTPNHTSAIRQNLRVPAFGVLCVQPFAFTEKSLCVVCHKGFVAPITFVQTPCQEHTYALYCCCSCKATFIAVRFFLTSRSVLGSPHCRSFHRVYPAAGHDVCSSRQLVLVHFFEDFHALQESELFLTSLLLGRHCHDLMSLEETFRRRLRAVTHFVSLLKSLDCERLNCFTGFCQYSFSFDHQ